MLTMPEDEMADSGLNTQDDLSLGQYAADADALADASASSLAEFDEKSARQYSLLA